MIMDVSGYLGVGIERVWKEVTFGAMEMLYVLIWMIVTQLSNSIELSIWDMYFIVFEALAQLEAGLSSWR